MLEAGLADRVIQAVDGIAEIHVAGEDAFEPLRDFAEQGWALVHSSEVAHEYPSYRIRHGAEPGR